MLEPADTGGTFWGARRATSTTNVALFTAPLTRRASERELADAGKKRATSAGGLDRKPGEGDETDSPPAIMSQSAYSAAVSPAAASAAAAAAAASATRVNRRKTDLMPTIPSPRDGGASPGSAAGARPARPFTRSPGLRSGEVTPTPPSRPLSALSQQSMSSVGSGVNLRPRPIAAPRRPRPVSIAVTGVSSEQMAAVNNATHRHSITGDPRPPKIPEKEGAKPPLPKVHSNKKPSTPAKKPILDKSKTPPVKASPRATPKATPLQSPGSEVPPLIDEKVEDKYPPEELRSEEVIIKVHDVPEPAAEAPELSPEGAMLQKEVETGQIATTVTLSEPEKAISAELEKILENAENTKPDAAAVTSIGAPIAVISEQGEMDGEMTASFIAKTRITTEEEAKAALAERRRLAREQAEREAELERQRQEEERRREEERLRQEEEEQRRFEEEQERLAEEARRAEEERLQQAILENQKREEEEKKRREEEARLKAEKEEAEKKAREEAERLRREMDEKLKKEEEERIARRKRVEAIMLRTRGKGSAASSSSAKGQEEGENDEGKDESPSEEGKPEPGHTNENILPQEKEHEQESATEQQLHGKQQSVSGNGHQPMDTTFSPSAASPSPALASNTNGKALPDSTSDLLIDTCSAGVLKPVDASEDVLSRNNTASTQSNGHQNGMDFNPVVGYINVDNVKQNNVTNNLLDLSEFDTFSATNNMNVPSQHNITETSGDFEQILDLSLSASGKLANEDNMNSNLVNTNGSSAPPAPIIAFQDGLVKKADNSVADLLS